MYTKKNEQKFVYQEIALDTYISTLLNEIPSDVLEQVEESKPNDQIIQCVTFRIGDEKYGINVMQVLEVLGITKIAPVPGAPSYVLGNY